MNRIADQGMDRVDSTHIEGGFFFIGPIDPVNDHVAYF